MHGTPSGLPFDSEDAADPLPTPEGGQVQGWKVKLSRMYVGPPESTLYPTYCELALELAGD